MRQLHCFVLAPVVTALALAVAGGLAAGPVAAQAIYDGALDGASVNPPTPSTGTGAAEVAIDEDQLVVDLSFSGLGATSTAAHIHCCAAPPTNVTVAISFLGFPVGVTSGVYANTYDLASAGTYSGTFVTQHGGTVEGARAALLAGLAAGQAYTCVHTVMFPGSEIRSHFAFASFADGFESGDTVDWSATVP